MGLLKSAFRSPLKKAKSVALLQVFLNSEHMVVTVRLPLLAADLSPSLP